MRTYLTPVKLHYMSANIPDVCSKRVDEKGTIFHCLLFKDFCKEVMKCLSEMFKIWVPLEPKLCVLGVYPKDFPHVSKTRLLDFGLRKMWILQHWQCGLKSCQTVLD